MRSETEVTLNPRIYIRLRESEECLDFLSDTRMIARKTMIITRSQSFQFRHIFTRKNERMRKLERFARSKESFFFHSIYAGKYERLKSIGSVLVQFYLRGASSGVQAATCCFDD